MTPPTLGGGGWQPTWLSLVMLSDKSCRPAVQLDRSALLTGRGRGDDPGHNSLPRPR